MITAAPRSRCSAHDALEHLRVDRVEALERLVDDEQVRVVEDGRDELRLLVHAARELGGLLPHRVAEAHLAQQARGAVARLALRQPAQRPEVRERVDDAHVPVEAAVLGQVADAGLLADAGRIRRRR